MLILSPNCWHESTTCFICGSHVDLYSREYERHLVAALISANAERRALGEIGDPSSLEALNETVEDENLIIRLAAQGALDQVALRLSASRL